jgi:methyltransferase
LSAGSAPVWPLASYLTALLLMRLHELRVSSTHARLLVARGAIEYGRGQLPALIAIHSAMPVTLVAEVLRLHTRPPAFWPLALAALVAATALRAASMRALGDRWTARVLVVPGEPRVTSGIFRWFAHPSYLAAAIELAAGPLMFGAWRTALLASVINAPVIAARMRTEQEALALKSR